MLINVHHTFLQVGWSNPWSTNYTYVYLHLGPFVWVNLGKLRHTLEVWENWKPLGDCWNKMRVNWSLQGVALPTWANDELIPNTWINCIIGGGLLLNHHHLGVTSAIFVAQNHVFFFWKICLKNKTHRQQLRATATVSRAKQPWCLFIFTVHDLTVPLLTSSVPGWKLLSQASKTRRLEALHGCFLF